MKRISTLFVAFCAILCANAQTVTFEGDYFKALIDSPQYNGALIYSADEYKWTDEATSLSSECTKADWTAWGYGYGWNNGLALSNYVDATATSYDKQLSVPASNGSEQFVVVWDNNSYLAFANGQAREIKSMDVINTSYALANIQKNCGEGYFFKATATGYNGEVPTGSVDIMLAEGEKAIDQWTTVDLSALGAVTKVVFTFDGSHKSSYGVSTPKYFALDNVVCVPVAPKADVTFEGDYFKALIDSPQYNGALIYSADEYKWTDETTSLSSECTKADWTAWGYGYGWNNGLALSNYVDATATSYDKQLSVPASNGSEQFVVVWDNNSYLAFANGQAREIKSMDVINTSYALANIQKNCGEGYFFKATATGYNGEEMTGSVDIMLAEGEKVIDQWTTVDLSALGAVTKVVFTFDGSHKSSYGVSTPKYFALDNIFLGEVATGVTSTPADAEATVVAIYTLDGKKVNEPVKGVNILRLSNGSSKKVVVE